jgi:hypothetical protein
MEPEIIGGENVQSKIKRYEMLPPSEILQGPAGSPDPLEPIAKETIVSLDELKCQLAWLSTAEAESAQLFAYWLGKCDKKWTLQAPIIDALIAAGEKGMPALLGGYLRALAELEEGKRLAVLLDLAQSERTRRFIHPLVWHSGLACSSLPRSQSCRRRSSRRRIRFSSAN